MVIHVNTKKHKENVNAHKVNTLEFNFPFISKSSNDPTKIICKICECELNRNPKFIQEHENSKKHKENVNSYLEFSLELDFPFISKSLNDPKKVFCKIITLQQCSECI